MPIDRNPQRQQMADESMRRTLRLQTEAIWPQESLLFDRYGLVDDYVLDVGCGTGEASWRLADRFTRIRVVGVDVLPESISEAGSRSNAWPAAAGRVEFMVADAFALPFPAGAFDLVMCRHVLQAIPDVEAVLREIRRVTRPGGKVHLLVEDYAMIHFHPTIVDADQFWHRGPIAFGASGGTDLRIGRKIPGLLRGLGFEEVRVDYVIVDTDRVDRTVFAGIWEAWRDGYVDVIAANTPLERHDVVRAFEEMIACIRDEDGYGVWFIPVVSAKKEQS